MGEAKRRGTREQRVTHAVDAARAVTEATQRLVAERLRRRERIVAELWATLTPEEKAKRLEKAKAEAAAMAEYMDLWRPKLDGRSRNRRND